MRVSARTARPAPALVACALGAVLTVALGSILAVGASAATPLGSAHPAKDPKVTIGMILDGTGSGGGSSAAVEQGARMAVSYQNDFGDGLNGHKIALHFCRNDLSPAGGLLCATDMVRHHVVAVVEPDSGQGDTEVPTLVQAGIPYITMTGSSAAEFTTHGAFTLQGGVPGILGAVALQAKQRGYTKVTLILENTPTVVQGVQILGGIVFKAAGVSFDVLTADPHASNLKPEVQSAVAGGASALAVGGNEDFCSAFLQAYAALHLHLPKYVISTCLGPRIVGSGSLDRVLKGSLLAGAFTSTSRDDVLYAAIVKRYAPSVNPEPNISSEDFAGLLPVLSLVAIMKGAPTSQPITAAGVWARTETAQKVQIPLYGGATFTCDGTAIPLLKSVCSSTAAIGVLGNGYRVTHIHAYDPTDLY